MSTLYAWDSVIILVRRMTDFIYPAKMSAANASEIRDAIRLNSRVYREDLVEFFLPTGRGRSPFSRLETVSRPEMHRLADVMDRGTEKQIADYLASFVGRSYVLSMNDLGRCKSDPDKSTGQSVLLWTKKNLAPHGLCDGEDVTPLVIPAKSAKKVGLI
jgi:hypothetical protein